MKVMNKEQEDFERYTFVNAFIVCVIFAIVLGGITLWILNNNGVNPIKPANQEPISTQNVVQEPMENSQTSNSSLQVYQIAPTLAPRIEITNDKPISQTSDDDGEYEIDEVDILTNRSLRAEYLGLTYDELYLMERVVEKESDRGCNLEGRIMIAEVIFNRVNSSYFPDSVWGVLTQSGQFSTVVNGTCDVDATMLSIQACVDAYDRIQSGMAPTNLLFFNSIGYNGYTAYAYCDGNYFMTYGEEE